MKKLFGVAICSIALLFSINFASASLGSDTVTVDAVRLSSEISPFVNDDKPYTIKGTVTRNGKTGYATTTSRVTADKTLIRDVDHIYVRVRAYGNDYLLFSDSKTEQNAADAYISKSATYDKPDICYGTHEAKEAGYSDIWFETYQ